MIRIDRNTLIGIAVGFGVGLLANEKINSTLPSEISDGVKMYYQTIGLAVIVICTMIGKIGGSAWPKRK